MGKAKKAVKRTPRTWVGWIALDSIGPTTFFPASHWPKPRKGAIRVRITEILPSKPGHPTEGRDND